MPVDITTDMCYQSIIGDFYLFIHFFFIYFFILLFLVYFFNSFFPSFSIYLFVTMISSVPGDVLAKKLVLVAPLPFEVNARIWKL